MEASLICADKRALGKPNWRDIVNRRFCLALDLKDDPGLIAEYEHHHEHVWPEIIENIKTSGIEDMEIYRLGTRMFMIMEVNEKFSFEAKSKADQSNPKVAEWEALMWKFQQSLPQAKPGEKWLPMARIFKL
jgi:L-rhamnose mutarotase